MIPTALILALIAVESNGCDYAVGDGGQAVGCLQIHTCVVDDVNRFSNRQFHYSERTCRAQAIQICVRYLSRYATTTRLGHDPTLEDLVRIWKGGPNGYLKEETLAYWNKVRLQFAQLAFDKRADRGEMARYYSCIDGVFSYHYGSAF